MPRATGSRRLPMPTQHRVQQGECLTSIAEQYGFFWQTLWDHPENARLRDQGRHPNTLMPGDVVHIPDKRMASYTRRTGARHTWKVKGIPAKLRVQILEDDRPRANEPFVLDVGGAITMGTTDGSGFVVANVPPRATQGVLTVGEGETATEYVVRLGHLDPFDTVSGVQARLTNLGFHCEVTGSLDDTTREALRAFQAQHGLAVTGDADGATMSRIRDLHDTL